MCYYTFMGTVAGQLVENWSRFLPGALVEWAEATLSANSPPEALVGALMVTDVSGFTRLTAKLSRESGQAGAERIGIVLNGYISKLVDTVERLGGAILNFEGNSLTAGWKAAANDASDLSSAVWKSCHCALSLQREIGQTTVEDEMLTLRSGVAAGTTYLVHLLSRSANRRVILTGPSMNEVSRCAALAESGETLVSPQAWSYVDKHAQGRAMETGPVRLLDIDLPPSDRSKLRVLDRSCRSDLSSYLPLFVRSRIGTVLPRWLAELRTVTTSFIKITGPDLLNNFSQLEQAVDTVQAKVTRFDGDLLRVTVCEGGLQALAVFGLPGKAHRDDPRRASLAGLELQAAVNQLGLHLSIGIATGNSFCGAIGTQRRAEYTVLGESVNRAARLSAIATGRTLVDDVTAHGSSSFVHFQGPWSMQVPGIRTPIPTFIALQAISTEGATVRDDLVNRVDELQELTALLDWTDPRLIFIVGEPGVGKSALVEAFLKGCRATGVSVLEGFADDVEHNTPYFAFRRIIKQLLGIEHLQGAGAYERVEARLARHPEQIAFIPLLSDVLDVGLAESSTTNELTSNVRSENLRRLLKDLLLDGLSAGPNVLVVEDVHWLDAASEALLADLLRTNSRIAVVLTSRTVELGERLTNILRIKYLNLQSLSEADTAKLVSSSLDQAEIPAWLQRAIWDRTDGNPFFVGEICRMIKQRRPETWSRIVPHAEALDESSLMTLPQSARAAVLSRTDALVPDEQFALKLASAMGVSFAVADLEAIELIDEAGINVADCIASLAGADLIKSAGAGAGRFTFSHRIIRDVVYASMLSEQKKEAHAAIARAIERGGRLSEAETLPLILNQWQRAHDPHKVFEYLDRVAELRLRQFDNAAAIGHIDAFLKIARSKDIAASPARLAAAHFTRAYAELSLGRIETAREDYESGLRILKLPIPRSLFGLSLSMVRQVAEHLIRSGWTRDLNAETEAWESTSITADDIMLRAARAHESLTTIYYFLGDKARLMYATLRAINLAERFAKPSPVLVVNYASLGAICGVIPLRRRARRYLELANRLSKQIGNPTVTVRVNLLSGLYETSVAQWLAAKALFEPALDQAQKLGDTRRWCELAVCLETVLSPWLLNPAYSGEEVWSELVEKICQTARASGDLQVLGSGLTAALRGHRALGANARAREYLDELAVLVRERGSDLEAIHAVEGAAVLADDALDRGDIAGWRHWLQQTLMSIDTVNPAVKSRTLPAPCIAFVAAIRGPDKLGPPDMRALRRRLAKRSAASLRRFARIYPIGRPRALLFRGDLEARLGSQSLAARRWRQALAVAIELEMPADACAALERLRSSSRSVGHAEHRAAQSLDALLARNPAFSTTAERAAGALAIRSYEGIDAPG